MSVNQSFRLAQAQGRGMYTQADARQAIRTAAALVLMDDHAGNYTLMQILGEFILAASKFQIDPSESNQYRMVTLARLPEVRLANHGEPLL